MTDRVFHIILYFIIIVRSPDGKETELMIAMEDSIS